MMQLIRSSAGKFMTVFIVGGFLVWMVYGIGMEVSGAGGGRPGELGSVNGTPIALEAYQARIQQLTEQMRAQGQVRLTAEQQKQLDDRAWEELVNELLVQQEMERRGIGVSEAELRFAARNIPAPQLAQQEIFQTNGQFDLRKYQSFLAGPEASDEVFLQLEAYYRNAIPQSKLQRQVAAGVFITDAELWRFWQDQNEKVTADYVALDLSRLAPGTPAVSETEIRRYYDAHKDEFERPQTARLTVAYLPTTVTAADEAATLARARAVRAEIAGGADFAAVARRESQDPASAQQGGDLGPITRGQMVAQFDSAVFALPVGELSQPVLTQFGYHLVQVQERAADGQSARARHILLPLRKSDEELAKLDSRADSLESLAQREGIERAARSVGATLRQGVSVSEALPYIPGVGPALESLQWAAAETANPQGEERPVSDLMETDQALYLVRMESYAPKGTMTLAEATAQIRDKLIVQKKREQARAVGRQMVAEARGGQSLQQVAARRGLVVQSVGPFARAEPNPVFGQATQATGAAFGTPVGKVSDVVETTAGLFILRPTAHTPADRRGFQAQREQLRAQATMRLQQEQLARWLDSVRRDARIKDNRDRVFGRAS